ncbi:MAG TPA: hypothetical protein VJ623_05030 [Holophagaceae bacterium]|nr:hypothetical protein [Holophagaceae bacterium]
MRCTSRLFLLLVAGAFLAALAWALVTQSNLWRAHAQPLRPLAPPPEAPSSPPASATGVIGPVDDATVKAVDRNLKAEQVARKRLDAPPANRK